MTRRTLEEENIRKLQKIRRSYYVSLPIRIIREFGWQDGQKLVIEKNKKGEITVRDWSAH